MMNKGIFKDIELIDNILQAEDFVRLRMETGFAEVPVEQARRALQNGLKKVIEIKRVRLSELRIIETDRPSNRN